MPDALCRLSVAHGHQTVDLALPRDTPVSVLMPSIVDLVHGRGIVADEARRWQLSRVGEERLDVATSLQDNDIRDGDVLFLTTGAHPAPRRRHDDPWQAAINTVDADPTPSRLPATAVCLCVAVLGATALVWSGVVTHALGHVITAGVIAAVVAAAAVAMRRAHADPDRCAAVSVIAVVFAAAAGFLAVPGGPSTANSLLAAAGACSTSIVLLRVISCGAICLTALATFTALTSLAAACGVVCELPVSTIGAALAVLAVGALGVAARLSIVLAGWAPAMPSSDVDEPAPNAVTAHRTLTGLVIGSSAAAALGAVVVAASRLHDGQPWPVAAVFASVVGLVVVLRARTHIEGRRRMALVLAGLLAGAAGLALIVTSAPRQANWVCLLITAAILGMMSGALGETLSPLARRAVDIVEYVALAAVVPLACWMGGLYGLVRGLSLP
jgi:ESX secretion system protein EccD